MGEGRGGTGLEGGQSDLPLHRTHNDITTPIALRVLADRSPWGDRVRARVVFKPAVACAGSLLRQKDRGSIVPGKGSR